VTDGQFDVVTVKNTGQTIGWLPYAVRKRWGFRVSEMPFLTHTLGPVLALASGRPNSQLLRNFSITSDLLQSLPKLAYFRQVLAPTQGEALAYQAAGYEVKVQFTFIADCVDIGAAWKNMRDKTRNLIRRSEEKSVVDASGDPEEFIKYYDLNCKNRNRINQYWDPRTEKLLKLCVSRDRGKTFLSKDQKTGAVNAGIFVVWDHTTMYFLMSTRAQDAADSGTVSLLIWQAMNEAHRRGLKFDFDGVISLGTFRFLSGFGGDIARRLVVEKFSLIYHAMDKTRALAYGNVRKPFS